MPIQSPKFFAALVFLATQPAWGDTDSPSLCGKAEQVVFACTIGKKLASVCAGKVQNSNPSYLQYRFGEKEKVEIQLPLDLALTPVSVAYRESISNVGFASYLRFFSGEYRYYVFAASMPGSAPVDQPEKYRRKEPTGILVVKNNRRIASYLCANRPSLSHFTEHSLSAIVSLQNADSDIDPYEVAFNSKP